ncbi:hypothetical protein M0805_006269 [Coniferiporia weirii]|nr:hypothetical protein M0805_006269 [Coniferiporia weirii]
MTGTPQLPLRYRRKADIDYRVYSPDLDMAHHSPTSSFHSRFSSDDSVPRSPLFYPSSSSSVAPSSPVRSLHTPEPPSSPLTEVHVASSPKSFWEVAFNYGPGLPYKARSSLKSSSTESVFGRNQFFSRRRSSNASVPALISDVDPSEYSEDIDPFGVDDENADDFDASGRANLMKIKEEISSKGTGFLDTRDDDGSGSGEGGAWSGEIDVAAVLLDLSRQVRIAPVESVPTNVAIKPIDRPLPDHPMTVGTTGSTSSSFIPTSPDVQIDAATQAVEPTEVFPIPRDGGIDISLSSSNECIPETHHCSLEATYVAHSLSTEPGSLLERPNDPHPEPDRAKVDSEDVDGPDTGKTMSEELRDEQMISSVLPFPTARISEEDADEEILSEVNSVIEGSIFSSTLTPLSSPILDASEASNPVDEPIEPLSCLPSPVTGVLSFVGPSRILNPPTMPTDKSCAAWGKENVGVATRPSSPIPGPSKARSSSLGQRSSSAGRETKIPLHRRDSRQSLNETGAGMVEKAQKRKRSRRPSMDETRSLSATPSSSSEAAPRQRKKKARKIPNESEVSQCVLESESTKTVASSSHAPSFSALLDPDVADDDSTSAKTEVHGCLIQAMALSRASSMPASSLLREVLRENPHLGAQRSKESWLDLVGDVLGAHDVFGRIDREGLDADDKPLEAQWFYIPENDPDQDRASLLREMMPKKRNETKKHKQYFYKPLGRITRWGAEDDA